MTTRRCVPPWPRTATRLPATALRVRVHPKARTFMLGCHHITIDLWSLALLVEDLGEAYTRACSDVSANADALIATRPPVNATYLDYVAWQKDVLNGAEGARRLWAFWQRELAGAAYVVNLPTERPYAAAQSYRGDQVSFSIGAEATRALHRLARTEASTGYHVLLAAFEALLYRYSGEDDVLIGTPMAGRRVASLESILGYFVNAVPIRVDVAGVPTFRDLVTRVRKTVVQALAHQDLPLSVLVEKLQPPRTAGRPLLFQTMFVYQNAHQLKLRGLGPVAVGVPGARLDLGDGDSRLSLESFPVPNPTSQFDLSLVTCEGDDAIHAVLQFNSALYERETAERMAGHFATLLEAAASQPDASIGVLGLLPDAERKLVVDEWNATDEPFDEKVLIHEVFEAQVARTPHNVAVRDDETAVDYATLNKRANQLSHFLRFRGCQPDSFVGLYLHRSIDAVVAILGVLKAGAAYVPLDPAYPHARVAMVVDDSKPSIIITQQSLADEAKALGSDVLVIDDEWDAKIAHASEADAARPAGMTSQNLCYSIYTSGSTGRPKGVLIRHYSVVAYSTHARDYMSAVETDVHTQFARLSFDSSVSELWVALHSGASLHIVPDDVRMSPTDYQTWLRRAGITLSWVPTPMSSLLIQLGWEEEREALKLRLLYAGGDELLRSPARRLPFRFLNMYGPTEDTIVSSWQEVNEVAPGKIAPKPSIGRPIGNHRCYVLDKQLAPVPIGVPGELVVSGTGVARGYLDREEATAKAFVPNPFSTAKYFDMVYRTGDLVRFLADGQIDFLGRIDLQVQLRGFRVELGEIEVNLLAHGDIREAAVVAKQEHGGSTEKRLVAFIAGSGVTTADAAAHLRKRVPDYMVPGTIVVLEELPKLANGKINRKALLDVDEGEQQTGTAYVAPRTPTEELVIGVMVDVLGAARVGINDNFFELGGHSLLANQLVAPTRPRSHARQLASGTHFRDADGGRYCRVSRGRHALERHVGQPGGGAAAAQHDVLVARVVAVGLAFAVALDVDRQLVRLERRRPPRACHVVGRHGRHAVPAVVPAKVALVPHAHEPGRRDVPRDVLGARGRRGRRAAPCPGRRHARRAPRTAAHDVQRGRRHAVPGGCPRGACRHFQCRRAAVRHDDEPDGCARRGGHAHQV